ncbi:SUKH-3 domain-containing protein [Streptomyces sp. RTd22]|uniref:SUKH-3 domain-containing protein n=1 Tax=Streptomyces sp. RTd22 TaxID=1841249 RepID=UPI002278966A|nr:SUKH-3 domain-containing protein [Streptomyces sp. RTd22]
MTDPTFAYDSDVKAIQELALELGVGLFSVGYESPEHGILLVDKNGRFFHFHDTGGHHLGENNFDTFSRFLRGVAAPDADDFFV